jgi:hypothetical protein
VALTRLCPFCLEALTACVCPDEDTPQPVSDSGFAGPQDLEVLHAPAEGAQYRGVVIIEWPPPTRGSPYVTMTGVAVSVFDAVTGKPIVTVMYNGITVRTDADGVVIADLTMIADEDGGPLFGGEPELDAGPYRTATFPFLVTEMRVRER